MLVYPSVGSMLRFVIFFWALALSAQTVRLTSGGTTVVLSPGRLVRITGDDTWENRSAEIDQRWKLKQTVATSKLVRYVFEANNLRLSWEWQVRSAPGPIEHVIRIQNLGREDVWLPLQDSLQLDLSAKDDIEYFWVEKGASSPSSEGTHLGPLAAGTEWQGVSSNYGHAGKNSIREMIPYVLVRRGDAGWYAGIEFSGRTRIQLRRDEDAISAVFGLNPEPGPYKTRLRAGETFEAPTVFLGAFRGDADDAGNQVKRWVRAALNNPRTVQDRQYPLLVSNSWGSGMAINEQQAHRMIDDAAALGLEMFHVDAGWFRGVGDWVSNPEKFPHGVAAVADYAHSKGLRFGLWTDWTQAGTSREPGALNVYDAQTRDWLTTDPPDGWKTEEFKGITIDIGVPAARDWAAAKAASIVRDMKLDMLEHDGYLVAEGCERTDHPHATAAVTKFNNEGSLWAEGSNSTDVSYYATRAYYEVQSRIRREFPALLFEICNDGGRMVDFGSAAHGDYFSITDAYDPLSNRQAVYDTSWVLPSAMLETYVQNWPTPRIENFRYMLRSGLMGWFSLMLDSNLWTAEQHKVAKAEFALYKDKLRPLIQHADVYHASARPTAEHWDGLEYFDPSTGHGVLYAFHGTSTSETMHTFPMKGVQPNRTYQVTFRDHTAADYQATGAQLLKEGIAVKSQIPNSSELVFFSEQ